MSRKSRILITDDVKDNLIALKRILSDLDVDIFQAEGGNQAVIAAFHNDFDLILMDVKMPDMDGFEAVRLIKKEEKNKLIPIIFLTAAYSDELSKIEGVKAGAVDFITKPISEDLLLGKVKLLLEIQENRHNLEQMSLDLSRANKKLKKMLFYDTLTGAINRKPMYDLLEKNINLYTREKRKFAILFLDLEKFKSVNDLYGHDVGDFVLKKAAQKIKDSIRKTDLLGRIGGDEFVVLLENIKNYTDAANIAQKINDSFKNKIKIDCNLINLTVSIGIAIFPNDGQNVIELLKNSDLAMFNAKQNNNNIFQFYNNKLSKSFQLNQSLFNAIENNEIAVHYQPIIDRNNKIAFVEALMRWENPKYKTIPVSQIVAILEKYKLIKEFGKWIIEKACNDINKLNCMDIGKKLPVSINLSEIQMEDSGFIEEFENIIKAIGIDSNSIYLEITERKEIKDLELITNTIEKLKNTNCKIIALDDFGSGYSSFSNLIRLPIDIAKIDKFLIDNLNSHKFRNATLDIIKLIKRINLKVVAEGIETREQFELLHEAGCDYFQGFYFYKPMSFEKLKQTLIEHNE